MGSGASSMINAETARHHALAVDNLLLEAPSSSLTLPLAKLPTSLLTGLKLTESSVGEGLIPSSVLRNLAASCHEDADLLKAQTAGNAFQDISFEGPSALGDATDAKFGLANGSDSGIDWVDPRTFVGADEGPVLFGPSGPVSSDVLEGSIGDCFLIAAVSVLAGVDGGNLIRRLFVPMSSAGDGALKGTTAIGVRFFHDNRWTTIVVDSRVPAKAAPEGSQGGSQRPIFGRARDRREMWMPLLEKAYAKLYGSFSAISGGNVSEAMRDLTGCACLDYSLTSPDTMAALKDGTLWQSLLDRSMGGGALIACAFVRGDASDDSSSLRGILTNHAYSVSDFQEVTKDGSKPAVRLVKVRNPWGFFEWDGPWSRHAPQWTANLRKALAYPEETGDEGSDGTFWMSWEDFTKNFNRIYVALLGTGPPPPPPVAAGGIVSAVGDIYAALDYTPPGQKKLLARNWCSVKSAWVLGRSAGGADHHPTWRRNPLFRVFLQPPPGSSSKTSGPPSISLCLSKPDARRSAKEAHTNISYIPAGICVVQIWSPGGGPMLVPGAFAATAAPDASSTKQAAYAVCLRTSFWNKRDVAGVMPSESVPLRRAQLLDGGSDCSDTDERNLVLVVPSTYDPGASGTFVLTASVAASTGWGVSLVPYHFEDQFQGIATAQACWPRGGGGRISAVSRTSAGKNPVFRLRMRNKSTRPKPPSKSIQIFIFLRHDSFDTAMGGAGSSKTTAAASSMSKPKKKLKLPGMGVSVLRGWESLRTLRGGAGNGESEVDSGDGLTLIDGQPHFTNTPEVSRAVSLPLACLEPQPSESASSSFSDESDVVLLVPTLWEPAPKVLAKKDAKAELALSPGSPGTGFVLEVWSKDADALGLELVEGCAPPRPKNSCRDRPPGSSSSENGKVKKAGKHSKVQSGSGRKGAAFVATCMQI